MSGHRMTPMDSAQRNKIGTGVRKAAARRRVRAQSEADLKRAVVAALTLMLGDRGEVLRLNAGLTVLGDGENKRAIRGVTVGTPDLLVMLQGDRYVWIELKTDAGKLSPKQEQWHVRAWKRGHSVAVCRSVEEALRVVRVKLDEKARGTA